MPIIDEKTRRFAANGIFPSFSFAVLGLVLAEVGVTQLHGRWGVHAFLGILGFGFSSLVLFRARLHWPAVSAATPVHTAHALGWYFLLFVVGAAIGFLVSAGSVLLLGGAAASMYLLPWTTIPVCRARFVVSSLVMLAGTVAWGLIYGKSVQSLYLMVAAWILYLPSMLMHVLVLVSLDRGYRLRESGSTGRPDLDLPLPR